MSTLPVVDGQQSTEAVGTNPRGRYAICLPPLPADARETIIQRLAPSSAQYQLIFAAPEQTEDSTPHGAGYSLVPYPAPRTGSEWVLTAADYAAAGRLTQERSLDGVVVLGSEAASLSAASLLEMLEVLARGADLVLPRYATGAQEGLVNSALLYPVSRALFGVDVRFPLPLDAAISSRLLARLSGVANRLGRESDALLWPVSEASTAGFSIQQVDDVHRTLPHPQEADLNVLLPVVASSLFIDVEAKATQWQRARPPATRHIFTEAVPFISEPLRADMGEVRALADGFRLAFNNLREVWALVLPPQSLLAIKKLANTPSETFAFPPNLWARVVYDFALAFHTRTLNRGHLLGSMTPMYLAWVAGYLREPAQARALLEQTAAAFEQEKPYLVSRWRWPDRFNP